MIRERYLKCLSNHIFTRSVFIANTFHLETEKKATMELISKAFFIEVMYNYTKGKVKEALLQENIDIGI